MRTLHIRRATWLLPLLILATPMLLPLEGRDHSKRPHVEAQQESPEIAGIVNHIIAGENQYNVKMREFSPRVETYVQGFQPDAELGDVANDDALFLGRLNCDKEKKTVKEISFLRNSSSEHFRRSLGMLKMHLNLDVFATEALTVDEHNFDRQHYTFEPVRWEYLGD